MKIDSVLSVDYKNKDDEIQRTYIDIPRGVIYDDKLTKNSMVWPIRRVKRKLEFWDSEEKEWTNLREEFNEAYDTYLKLRKLVQNAELDEAINNIILSDEDE